MRIDRAEPAQSGLVRPDNAFLADQQRLLVGWPTKLALAPDLRPGRQPPGARRYPPAGQAGLAGLPRPPLGVPAWEQLLP
ncbi:hypothetical protein PPTS312_00120 [Pseudomonas putida]|uniref:Uncharacterized protein n=1 Tax=Pseudomonas putida TaxID=303 RepID=A0A7U6LXE6_PSEPU|nr:hypothetical protein [Pseudomonas putida]BBU42097.1 hypothetical protein PPTS312_00120 [Pseudomonas putida]